MLSGFNHLTLAVRNLERSLEFYSLLLSCRIRATWRSGTYLSVGDLWPCLSLDSTRPEAPSSDYTHYAFSIAQDEFDIFAKRLRDRKITEWKVNRSEGNSIYFFDPDEHKLEVHSSDLDSRLAQCRIAPYDAMRFFD